MIDFGDTASRHEQETGSPPADLRLYVPDYQSWRARIKSASDKLYCSHKQDGQNYFHLILPGEVYLESGDQKLCLQCAARLGILTTDRQYWQHRGTEQPAGLTWTEDGTE